MLERQNPWGSAFESLEPRLLLAGDVLATLSSSGILKIRGDADPNQVEITQVGGGSLNVAGITGTGTTINGGASELFNDVTRLKVKLGRGDDVLVLRNVEGIGGQINLGKEADQVFMYDSEFDGKVKGAPVVVENHSPSLAAIGNQTTNELAELTFTASATDSDVPAQPLVYSLTGTVPTGAVIGASTGVFTWTPTEAQGPGAYTFTVVVSDGTLTDSEEITVTVNEVNVAPVLAEIGPQSTDELTLLTFTASATDSDVPAQPLVYSLTGDVPDGAVIDPDTGVFTWTPTEAQGPGAYTFTVVVSDGALTDSEEIIVTVNEVNVAPVLAEIGPQSIDELTELTFTASATDSDVPGQTLTYSLSGEPDGAVIDASTGVFTWTPTEAQGPGAYTFTVVASDGTLTDSEAITVTVNEVNVAPVLAEIGPQSTDELTLLTFTASASDDDVPAQTLTYSLSGEPDGAVIDPDTGVFTWTPTEAQGPGAYAFTVVVSDGSLTDSEEITVTVNEVNQAQVFTSSDAVDVPENTTAVVTVTATDVDLPAQTITYTITGGADAALFTIDGATGAIAFLAPPDFEAPLDADLNNVYLVQVTADDGAGGTTAQDLSVTIIDVNEAPVVGDQSFLVNPGAANGSTVGIVLATDPEGAALTYTIVAGDDDGTFGIEDPSSGEITVANNAALGDHSLTVSVSDGVNTTTATITITLNTAPVFTSNANVDVAENTTFVVTVTATDAEQPTVTYSITGGADAGFFTIDGTTGVLSFIEAPNYEAWADDDGDNVYEVTVTADDGAGLTTDQDLEVTVADVTPEAPRFTSTATPDVDENDTFVVTVVAVDEDPFPGGGAVTYSITGGVDGALFTIDGATGDLAFLTAPDYEAPADANADNVYEVTVRASNGTLAGSTTQNLSVTVNPVADTDPVFTSNANVDVDENTTSVVTVTATDADLPAQTVTYSITGGADQLLFTIDGATGALAFLAAPDFEAPADFDGDNVYEVTVTADDGAGGTTDQDLTVTVTPVNDNNPVITSAQYVNVDENTTFVVTVTATDADLPGDTLTYSITGGVDQQWFTINSSTGDLAFLAAPDFEAPTDANANNVYLVQVTVSDGAGGLTNQTVWVTVTNVVEP